MAIDYTTFFLSPEQETKIKEEWNKRPDNPPSLEELTHLITGDTTLDVRSIPGREIRKFLGKCNLRFATKKGQEPEARKLPYLRPRQKENIFVLYTEQKKTPLEITRIVYENPGLNEGSYEYDCVVKQVSKIEVRNAYAPPLEDIVSKKRHDKGEKQEFVIPNSPEKVIQRINTYADSARFPLRLEDCNSKQKKCVSALGSYLKTYRLISQIETFDKLEDRVLFESEFVRCCYDKEDLTQEEVDQYIVYATEVVISRKVLARIDTFQEVMDTKVDADEKLSVAMIDAIGKLRDDYNASIKRQQDLLRDLKGKRSERLKDQIKETANILTLVQMWKDEESRKAMIKLAEMKKAGLKEEISRLNSMDDVICRVMGISENEVLNG